MDDNKLEAKLLKIKALAERGEGGEKEAAIKMYHKLLKKYDIDEKALQKDKLSKHWFTYETDIEENLLVQIFYMVTGEEWEEREEILEKLEDVTTYLKDALGKGIEF